jgi:alpha-glucosidase (family GH31 glycosyl hydrolase)
MRDYVSFTYNDEHGGGGFTATDVRVLNDYLAAHSQYHVLIFDPNVPVILIDKDKQPYLPYVNGKDGDLFIRHPANDTFLFGRQWPAVTVAWPDWTNPAITSWWEDNFRLFGDIAGQVGGVWLDMNEPSNFCDGQISVSCQGKADPDRQLDPIAVPHPPVSFPTDIPTPPYQPGLPFGRDMQSGSFNISSHLFLGQAYDVKELWGMMEQRATATAMANIHRTRPFTLSRSTFMGSGSWGAHWLGDNYSNWDDLRRSIAEVLSMGLYGITMVGADICGFNGDTTAELCTRWIQLGSLYPFARDHSTVFSKDQEAYRFGEPYVSINRNSIKLRYSLLPYFYQLFVDSHRSG